ncbi:hypothetical protein LXL04_005507 [Taraxacum kok-saghyz]
MDYLDGSWTLWGIGGQKESNGVVKVDGKGANHHLAPYPATRVSLPALGSNAGDPQPRQTCAQITIWGIIPPFSKIQNIHQLGGDFESTCGYFHHFLPS